MNNGKFYYTNAAETYDYFYVKTVSKIIRDNREYRLIRVTDDEKFQACQLPRYESGLCQAFELTSDTATRLFLPNEPYAGENTDPRTCDYCGGNDPFGPMTHYTMPDATVAKHCNSCFLKSARHQTEMREEMDRGFALRYEAWENVPGHVSVILKGKIEFIYDGCWQAKGCSTKSDDRYFAPPSETADAAEAFYKQKKAA